jgi:hypothetical protein
VERRVPLSDVARNALVDRAELGLVDARAATDPQRRCDLSRPLAHAVALLIVMSAPLGSLNMMDWDATHVELALAGRSPTGEHAPLADGEENTPAVVAA